jgi:beta-glucosidase
MYSSLDLSTSSVTADGEVEVTVTVTNSGGRTGTEVVQLYVEDDALGLSRPALQLAGFQRITLEPGQEATVVFTLQLALLAYLSLGGKWIVEPGPMTISVGSSSDHRPLNTLLNVTGGTADVTDSRAYLTESSALVLTTDLP